MQAKLDTLSDKTSSESSELNFFPRGVFIPKNLSPSSLHLKALNKLLAGQTKTTRLEKLHHKHNLHSIRASKGARIIGIIDSGKFLVVAFYDKHQYDRLKLINIAGINHPVIDLEEPTQEAQDINQSLNQMSQTNYWRKGHFINRQAIYYSDVQDQIINTDVLPLIVTGAAGSGKTLIIITRLVNAYLAGNQRSVYIAPTLKLAQHAQKLFEEQIAQLDVECREDPPNTSFVSLDQFIDLHKSEQNTVVNKESLLSWLKEQKTKSKTTRKLLAHPETILEEFKTIAVFNKKAYLKLGTHQSLYETEEEKNACFDLYEMYVKKHPDQCQMLFPTLEKNKTHYDMLIIDEGQAFTLKQLYEITQTAVKGRFLVFGDPLQNVQNKISIFPQLKQYICDIYRVQDPIIILPTTYRNPLPVIRFANAVMKIRRLLLGGISDKCETIKLIAPTLEDPDALPVEWIDTIDELKREELAKLLNEPNTMVLTDSEESRKRAETLFDDPTILFAEHALGLEAVTVFVYCLFTPELIKRINKYLQGINLDEENYNLPKKNKGTHEFTNDLDRLFTAVTRVMRSGGKLIVYMGDSVSKHESELFYSLLTCSITQEQSSPKAAPKTKKITTINQWQEWIKKIYDSGNTDEAYRLFCKHINTGEKEYNLVVGKKESLPVADAKPIKGASTPSEGKKPAATKNSSKKLEPKKGSSKPKATPVPKVVANSSSFFKTTPLAKTETKKIVQPGQLSEKEVIYLNNLLNSFYSENITTLLKHKRADCLLFITFKAKNQNKSRSLYEVILENPKFLAIFYDVLQKNPFLATGKLFKYRAVITKITATCLDVANKEVDTPLVNSQYAHAKSLIALLELLIRHHPNLTKFLSKVHLTEGIFDILTGSGQSLLYYIIKVNPQLVKDIIEYLINTNTPSAWYLSLMETQIGAAILVKMYEINPNILSVFKSQSLNGRIERATLDTPIYFWLSTTIKGQDILSKIIPDQTVISKTLNQPIKSCDPYYNGTTTQYWLSATEEEQLDSDFIARAKQLSIAYEYTGLTYPGWFSANSSDEELIQLIEKMPASDQIIKENIDTIFGSNNIEALLFDYVNGERHTLFSRIAKSSESLKLFLEALDMRPEHYKIFSMDRLNQEVIKKDKEGNLYIESVLFTLVNQDMDFLTNLFKHNPDIKASFNTDLLLKTIYIHFKENKRYNLLTLITPSLNDLAQVLLLKKEIFTPEFAAELFRISSEDWNIGLVYGFPWFNILLLDPDKARQLIDICPQMLQYFTEEHLYLTPEKNKISEFKNPKVIHYLCRSFGGVKILNMLIDMNPDIVKSLTLEEFIEKTTFTNSIMMHLCQTAAFVLFNKIFNLKPDLFTHLNFSHLLQEGESSDPNRNFTLLEFLCHLADTDSPKFWQFLTKNNNFMSSIKPEILLSKFKTTLARFCNSRECLSILEELCRYHPSLGEGLTKEIFYEESTCVGNKSMFQSLFDLCMPEIKEGKNNILKTLFKLNPSLLKLPKNHGLTFVHQLEQAIETQDSFISSPRLFSQPKQSLEDVVKQRLLVNQIRDIAP